MSIKSPTTNEYKETQSVGNLSWENYVKFFKIGGGIFGKTYRFKKINRKDLKLNF